MTQKNELPRNPYPTTDTIIEYFIQEAFQGIPLITRNNPPYGIALPGGFVEYGLSFEENAIKESKEETNLDVIVLTPEHPLCVHSRPDRDPRAHITSITYVACGRGFLKAKDDARSVRIYTRSELEHLLKNERQKFAFEDHARALDEYINRLVKNKWEYMTGNLK